jgi:hypothetical protein
MPVTTGRPHNGYAQELAAVVDRRVLKQKSFVGVKHLTRSQELHEVTKGLYPGD